MQLNLYATSTFFSNDLFDPWNLRKTIQNYTSYVLITSKAKFFRVEPFEQPQNPQRSNTYPMKSLRLDRELRICYHVTIIQAKFVIKLYTSKFRVGGL